MKTKRIVIISIMTALSFILSLIRIPIIPIAPFLTLDISSLPLLILAKHHRSLSYRVLLLSLLMTLLLHGFALSELIGMIATIIFNMIAIELLSRQSSYIQLVIWEEIVMILINLCCVLPLYRELLSFSLSFSIEHYIIWALIPFNFIKTSILYSLFRILRNVG